MRAALLAALVVFSIGCEKPPSKAIDEHRARGDAALAAGQYAIALAAYQHARELAPLDGQLQRAVMKARVYVIAEDPSKLPVTELADAEYQIRLLLDTDKASAAVYHTALGHVHVKAGRREQAKASYDQALAADATSPIVQCAVGFYWFDQGGRESLARARDAFDTALRARPDLRVALIGIARVKLTENDPASAADKLESALRLADDFQVRMLLATARMRQERPSDAVDHYRRATQLEPRDVDALSGLGQSLLGAGRAADAEPVLRTVLDQRPDRAIQSALGFALNQQKKFSDALAIFQAVLAKDPNDPTALLGAGVASEGLSKIDDASGYYQKVLAVPVEGPRRDLILASQRDAKARLDALSKPAPPKPTK